MAGRIISFICYLLCAVPFWTIAKYNKNSKEPISFWHGDTSGIFLVHRAYKKILDKYS